MELINLPITKKYSTPLAVPASWFKMPKLTITEDHRHLPTFDVVVAGSSRGPIGSYSTRKAAEDCIDRMTNLFKEMGLSL